MATKNMAYDNPAYLAVLPLPTGSMTGSGGASTKYAAFTAMTVKSVTIAPALGANTATSNDVLSVLKISGTATTTTAYGTMGSGAAFLNATPGTASNQVTLVQGDVFWAQKGTDASGTYAGMIETVINPLSNLTAP
jgi:hypothetical protein